VKGKKEEDQLNIEEFVDIKGWKALGNKLIDGKISKIREIETAVAQEERESPKKPDPSKEVKTKTSTADPDKKETPKAETKPTQASLFDDGSASKENKDDDLSTGDTIEFDID
jgi:topoisomerase-4 subunit A